MLTISHTLLYIVAEGEDECLSTYCRRALKMGRERETVEGRGIHSRRKGRKYRQCELKEMSVVLTLVVV